MAGSREYNVWQAMVERCRNPKCKDFESYGGRGITVADEWTGPGGFSAFRAHMGGRPTPAHTIERINNNRGYEPGNVRWATRAEQSRNRRGNRLLTFRGETLTLTDWAARLGLSDHALWERLEGEWSVELALSTPKLPPGVHRNQVTNG